MAMRQWDGGPKAVKADGGGGFLGGAIAGFTGGVAKLSLEEFKEEQQRETARIQNEALKLMKEEEYKRNRQDKITDRDEERQHQGLLRAEERGYEFADEEAKRKHEIAMQELRNAGGSEGGGKKMTSTDRKEIRAGALESIVASVPGVSPVLLDKAPSSALNKAEEAAPGVKALYEQLNRDLIGLTIDEAADRMEQFYADLDALISGGTPAPASAGPAPAGDRKPLTAFD